VNTCMLAAQAACWNFGVRSPPSTIFVRIRPISSKSGFNVYGRVEPLTDDFPPMRVREFGEHGGRVQPPSAVAGAGLGVRVRDERLVDVHIGQI
jgi:hypothetical protein